MAKKMNWVIFGFLLILTIVDGLATFNGTVSILGETQTSYIFGAVFALIIGFILTSTVPIFNIRGDFLTKLLPLFWFIALTYDIYTSYLGNLKLLDLEFESFSELLNSEQGILVIVITALISGSSVVISYFIYKR